jgi:6-phosphogluconolactonase
MAGEDPDPARAARDYASTLRFVLGSPPVMDIALLGVGEDGHVASLFPGRPALQATDPTVLVEDDSPKPPPVRLTLSLDVLASAREVIVAAFGASKAAAVTQALEDPASELPLARLLHRAARATVMLDEEAASLLGH